MDADSGPHAAVPGREPRGQGQATPEPVGGKDGPTLLTPRLCTSGLRRRQNTACFRATPQRMVAPGHKHVAHPHIPNQPAGDEGSWK